MHINELRRKITSLDEKILECFLDRMLLADEVARYKHENKIPLVDKAREQAILGRIKKRSGEYEYYANRLFCTLMELSKERQCELFPELLIESPLSGSENERIVELIAAKKENIVIIGMPGSGKTTVGIALADLTGREFIDLDEEIVKAAGKSIPEIFEHSGEEAFRKLESEQAALHGAKNEKIIACGGGIVKFIRNYAPLHQKGRIYHIERDISLLAREGRPLSIGADLEHLYQERLPLYTQFRDAIAKNDKTPQETAEQIWRDFNDRTCY
jgi:shikimate kinase/chorismate mutase